MKLENRKVFLLVALFFENRASIRKFSRTLRSICISDFKDTLKVSVPSFLYVIQTNLFYVGIEHLPAAVYQVCSQSKLLTTAVFSVLMLGKEVTKKQWGSLVLLFIGVGIVQVNNSVNQQVLPADVNHHPTVVWVGMCLMLFFLFVKFPSN